MPKRQLLRRFEPRYGVGASVVAEEASFRTEAAREYSDQKLIRRAAILFST